MSYEEEFSTVVLLLGSQHETRSVDAFALSLIKAERQMRRLVTYLVFQFPCFRRSDVEQLREILANNSGVYFDDLERGFDALYPRSVRDLIGSDYDKLRRRLCEAEKHRNKIFHGQLTLEHLSRQKLEGYISDIRGWCQALSGAALSELQYDGFGRNSFRKCTITNFHKSLKIQFVDASSYQRFIKDTMERKRKGNQCLSPLSSDTTSRAAAAGKPPIPSQLLRTPDRP
jgi:hypothetical protein